MSQLRCQAAQRTFHPLLCATGIRRLPNVQASKHVFRSSLLWTDVVDRRTATHAHFGKQKRGLLTDVTGKGNVITRLLALWSKSTIILPQSTVMAPVATTKPHCMPTKTAAAACTIKNRPPVIRVRASSAHEQTSHAPASTRRVSRAQAIFLWWFFHFLSALSLSDNSSSNLPQRARRLGQSFPLAARNGTHCLFTFQCIHAWSSTALQNKRT